MGEARLETAAIGSLPSAAEAAGPRCMFCHGPLRDEAAGFLEHVAVREACRDAYASWLEHLDADRAGG
jgi:hypothetical protein